MRRQAITVVSVVVLACGGGDARQIETEGREGTADNTAVAEDTAVPAPSSGTAPDTISVAPESPATRDSRMTQPSPETARGDTSAQGEIRAAGAVPTAQLVLRSETGGAATQVGITGPLRAELGNLVGATVRVWGKPVANQPPPPARAIEVSRYDLLSVNGRNPYVGTLAERDGALWLQSERELRIADPPEGLVQRAGAKVWIVGSLERGALTVQAYGVIRLR